MPESDCVARLLEPPNFIGNARGKASSDRRKCLMIGPVAQIITSDFDRSLSALLQIRAAANGLRRREMTVIVSVNTTRPIVG